MSTPADAALTPRAQGGSGPGSVAQGTAETGSPRSDAADAPLAQDTPAPLTSLTSLLGGSFEGGAACAADGTCD